MSRSKRPRLLLIDGNSQMYRAYHAIPDLTGPDGRSTNAVYGFITMLRKLIDEQQPEYIAAAFDLAGPTFRQALATDYKANRAPMPADLVEQVPWIHQACRALGVPVMTVTGYEADDVIGTLAHRVAADRLDVVIVTADKDFFQLVGEGVTVYNPRDEGTWYDATGVREKFGVRPDQVVDVLALMGDPIDNVKGVPSIGEKGARALIAAHGSLDALLAGVGTLSRRKYREALTTHADAARQSRDLVRIHTDVPLDSRLETLRYGGPARAQCFALCTQLGFRSLLPEYAPAAETLANDYRPVRSLVELEALSAELAGACRVALHVVSDSPGPMRATIVGLAFATSPGAARYVPLAHTSLDARAELTVAQALSVLAPVLEDPAIPKVGHDLKLAALVLRRHNVVLRGLDGDTMLASYVLDATRPSHRLEERALEQLGYNALTEEAVRGRGTKAVPFSGLPLDAALRYAGERADVVLQVADRLDAALAREGLTELYRTLELPLIPVLVDIERAGIRVDTCALARQSRRIDAELASRRERIIDLAGEEFNINSPRQLSEILFEKLQLPASRRTGKTRTASTAVDVLEELAQMHELPRRILEWRALQKLKGTYVDALPQLVHPDTGRVHTSFNQAVAATGRLSSREPNLQNIPIRTEAGRDIRRAFIADPGTVLISADYSQIELRVLAHLSGDAMLIEAFQRGEDIHERTARQIFGPASALDRHELRRRAKIVNYALLYGKTAFSLARDIGVTQQAAQAFIDAYFAGFPAVRQFIDTTLATARETGIVATLFGRRRRVPELRSRNGQIRSAAERVTVNLPIQGTAADILKRAMIDLHAELIARRAAHSTARMILTVHDELLFEVPEAEAEELAQRIRQRMEQAVSLRVPLRVHVGIGHDWNDAKG